ncbi:MAG: serine--tRNA ligase [Oscillospiraceae bacterium]|jgi:seryl-tRNA synthetase|nr:serine--tRNA ligase [Oscillospiraceae bacterium]
MLDIRYLRENTADAKRRLLAKGCDASAEIDRILELYDLRRAAATSTDSKRSEQNKVSKEMPQLKKQGTDVSGLLEKMKALSDEIKADEARIRELESEYYSLMLGLYNLPDEDLKPGGKENNEPIRTFGYQKVLEFEPKHHVDLCTKLGLIDYERGTKLAGNGFWVYRGLGARLEWALLNYFIDTHIANGYEFTLLPLMLEYECGVTAGQFPKFADEVFQIANPTDERVHYMLPTAEAALVNLHRGELLSERELPRKYISYSPCFRREAGSYRASERGMVRGHQFNKVEMFQFTTPESSDAAFDELVTHAENLVQGLGLHFRTVKLAAGDCSAAMARTYDIEVRLPSLDGFIEVSSVSNSRDYPARRGAIRFRRDPDNKIDLVHTLNGSGLATSRIFPAIVEQYQQADGSVVVPEVLRRYLGGLEVIS